MTPDDPTLAVYEARAAEWREQDRPNHEPIEAFGTEVRRLAGPIADLGCGPGSFLGHLGPDAVGLDGSSAMLDLAKQAGGVPLVQADVRSLPFGSQALAGALASKVYVHLPRSAVPLALAELHRAVRVGGLVELIVFGDEPSEYSAIDRDRFAGRWFSSWDEAGLIDTVTGAGFHVQALDHGHRTHDRAFGSFRLRLRRERTLADTVGPDMRLLVCGLNPSLHAADAGVGFVSPSNRFWPAAIEAGLVDIDRDPVRALRDRGVGMTDLVKRATTKAAELTTEEYREGLARVGRLAAWLHPAAVCFVGLAGWRAAVNRRAAAGWQPEAIGGRPVYLMPSTSGLNASSRLADLVDHLRAAVSCQPGASPATTSTGS